MNIKQVILLIFISACLYSCGFVIDKEIYGKYHIIAVDVKEDTCLGYSVGDGNYACIIPERVLAYANNEHYIFLKQTPLYTNDTIINYYIVPIVNDSILTYPEDQIIGPLDKREFDIEARKRIINDVIFKDLD